MTAWSCFLLDENALYRYVVVISWRQFFSNAFGKANLLCYKRVIYTSYRRFTAADGVEEAFRVLRIDRDRNLKMKKKEEKDTRSHVVIRY